MCSDVCAEVSENLNEEDSIKKSLAVAGAVVSVGLASISGIGLAAAQDNTSGGGLVDKIAQKFNLKKEDVQKVFDEDRAAQKAERKQKMEDRLAQAVKDGKLTQTQADMIKAKQAEMEAFEETLKDKTKEERHEAMKAKMDEFKKWADDNNIPKGYGMSGYVKVRSGGREDGVGSDFEIEKPANIDKQ